MTPGTGAVKSFADLKKGMRAQVVRVTQESAETVRLQEMGLTPGTTFRVVKVAPFGDPIEIELRGYRLCLRKRETDCFEIEVLD
ncbi:FeoA family protein [Fimbriimonas ginsengisoli]|uniref:Ferrous iron transport protein A n=1 Tax=Fimbriimonas ginsengisoli Gsoil 348 TaxID=661478 RepID=A0A068NYY0_FIMGI|nr:FeoA family protein [Fimbriimonas ginsengisoli]AIE87609.1 ferrous iron transport protein A [Fimbriimonas ginsengisoli Gsoil 348]